MPTQGIYKFKGHIIPIKHHPKGHHDPTDTPAEGIHQPKGYANKTMKH